MSDAEHGRGDSIDDRLGDDHERLGGVLAELREGLVRRSETAADAFGRFAGGLSRHMEWEDTRLFPAVKARADAAERRSIESLEIDHERLRETLKELKASLAARDFEGALKDLDWIVTLLKGHNYDEEHGVYEVADRVLAADERRRLLLAFRSEA